MTAKESDNNNYRRQRHSRKTTIASVKQFKEIYFRNDNKTNNRDCTKIEK